MPLTEIVLTAVAGAAVKRLLREKLGDFEDPDNLLCNIAADSTEDLAITAFLHGGIWVLTNVTFLEPTDPRLESIVTEALEGVAKEKQLAEQRVESARRDRLRVFNEVYTEIDGIWIVLYNKGLALGLIDTFSSLGKMLLGKLLPYPYFPTDFRLPHEYKVMFNLSRKRETILIELGTTYSIVIRPAQDGYVAVVWKMGFEAVSTQHYDSAAPVTKFVVEKITEFLGSNYTSNELERYLRR